jgi:prepilin-type processing-associated H-X9-DG protein
MQRRAFTLIDLLVVVGIVVVLAVVMWPLFAQRRKLARQSSCQQNLKQISLAIKQYRNDFDERFPLVSVSSGSPTGVPPYGWADAIQPYIGNTAVYQCPSDANWGKGDPTKPNYCDYWYNANLMMISRGRVVTPDEFFYTDQFIVLGDGGNTNGTPTGDARYNICGDGTALTSPNQVCPRSPLGLATFPTTQIHQGGANLAFADGHVKWFKGDSLHQMKNALNNGAEPEDFSKANAGKIILDYRIK